MNESRQAFADAERKPPCARKVTQRALVLASLACRGAIEGDAANPQAEDFRSRVVNWLALCDCKAEPKEQEVLSKPLGKLSQEEHAFATWQTEGLVILGWSLGLVQLPDYEECGRGKDIADALGWFTESAKILIETAKRRPTSEIQIQADKLFALDWRLADYTLRKQSINFQEFAKTAWFGPLNIDGLRFMKNDLQIGGVTISEANEEARSLCRLITQNRRRAAEWLLGQNEIYSAVDLST